MPNYNPYEGFANDLLRRLQQEQPMAHALIAMVRGKRAVIGFTEDDEWIPLLRLSNTSAAANPMNLDVQHKRGWARTPFRGIPADLVEQLAGPLGFTWQIALTPWPAPSDGMDTGDQGRLYSRLARASLNGELAIAVAEGSECLL